METGGGDGQREQPSLCLSLVDLVRLLRSAEVDSSSSERRWRQVVLVALVAGCALLAALWHSVLLGPRVVHRRVALGVAIAGAPGSLGVLESYMRMAAARPSIVLLFRGFDDQLLYSGEETNLRRTGIEPMVTWGPAINGVGVPLAAVADGQYDAYIRSQAELARAWGRPMFIRFGHEMNLRTSLWGSSVNGNTPDEYVAAWRHVVSIFREEGATNVRWVWAPNVDCSGTCPFTAYFPGDEWVNDVGLDGYNFASAHHVAWKSFSQLFRRSYSELTTLSRRPIIITETASVGSGPMKANWIRNAFLRDIPQTFPRITAVIWWDRSQPGSNLGLNSSREVAAAWRQVANSSLYRRRAGV